MVDFLVRFHLWYSLRKNSAIGPKNIPVVCISGNRRHIIVIVVHLVRLLILVCTFEVKKGLGDELNHKVLCVAQVYDQSFLVFKFRVIVIIFNSNWLSKSALPCIVTLLLLLFFGYQLRGSSDDATRKRRSFNHLLGCFRNLNFRFWAVRAFTRCIFCFFTLMLWVLWYSCWNLTFVGLTCAWNICLFKVKINLGSWFIHAIFVY